MITQPYDYHVLKPKMLYYFESVGEKGRIVKIVLFTELEENTWNLGFGDLNNELIDDSIVTNNQDALKVVRTVAKIAIDFLGLFPQSTLVIKPIDEKRKRLYNLLFKRHFEEINRFFVVSGFQKDQKEPYSPSKFYDTFDITLKF